MNPYLDLVNFILKYAPAEAVLEFRASEEMHDYAYGLLAKEKAGTATSEERHELDLFVNLEHIVRLIKAKAHRIANQ